MKRLLVLLCTAFATVTFGAIIHANVIAQAQPESDPFPECEAEFAFTAEASDLRPDVGDTVVYTATITNRSGQDIPHIEVGVWFGQMVFVIGNFTLMMDNEAGHASTILTPGMPGHMFNRPYALQYDMYGQPICASFGKSLDIQVGNHLYLPFISK